MDYDDQEVIKEAIEVKEKKGFEAMKLAIERYIFSWREEIEGLDPEDESYTSLQKALVSITIYFASECRTNKQEKTAEEAFIDGCNDDHTKTSSRLWNEFARFFEDLGRPTDSEKTFLDALKVENLDDKDSVWDAFLEMMQNQDGRSGLSLDELKKAVEDKDRGGDDEDDDEEDEEEDEEGNEKKDDDDDAMKIDTTTSSPSHPPPSPSSSQPPTKKQRTTEATPLPPPPAFRQSSSSSTPQRTKRKKKNLLSTNPVLHKIKSEAEKLMGYEDSDRDPTIDPNIMVTYVQTIDAYNHGAPIRPISLFTPTPPTLPDAVGASIIGAERSVALIELFLEQGETLFAVIEGVWMMSNLRENELHNAVVKMNAQHENELEFLKNNTLKPIKAASSHALQLALQHQQAQEHANWQEKKRSQMDELEKQVVWRLRELLEKQQTILKSCNVPGFEEVTIDPNVVEMQSRVCCVLHFCLNSWKKVGHSVYMKSLEKELSVMKSRVLEEQGQKLLAQAQAGQPISQPAATTKPAVRRSRRR